MFHECGVPLPSREFLIPHASAMQYTRQTFECGVRSAQTRLCALWKYARATLDAGGIPRASDENLRSN
jgi:hypothetical protein